MKRLYYKFKMENEFDEPIIKNNDSSGMEKNIKVRFISQKSGKFYFFIKILVFSKDLEQALKIIKQLEAENSRLNDENKQVCVKSFSL